MFFKSLRPGIQGNQPDSSDHPLRAKLFRWLGSVFLSLMILYLFSVGPVVAICRMMVANPWTIPSGLNMIEAVYSPLFALPGISDLVEVYVDLWEKVLG